MVINRRLKKLNQRKAPYVLPRLANKANKYYHQSRRQWQGYAKAARRCGEALNQARYYGLWKRRSWKKWLEDNFDGSYETAKVYMRIAKKWNDPRLVKARKQGMTLDSINGILQVLKGTSPNDTQQKLTEEQAICSMIRDALRKKFSEELKNLFREELEVFDVNFDNYWPRLYRRLYKDTCNSLTSNGVMWKEGKLVINPEVTYSAAMDYNQYLWESGQLEVKKRKPPAIPLSRMSWSQADQLGVRASNEYMADAKITSIKSRLASVREKQQIKINARRKVHKALNPKKTA